MSRLSVDHTQLVARARHLAGKIVDGEIRPFEGATLIWRECHLKTFDGDHTFDPFVYWQDEYEDAQSEERRQRCAEIIRQVARQFLGGPEVVLDRSDLEPSISSNRKRDRSLRVDTKADVADIIERFLDGSGGEWNWDDFLSSPIGNPELDQVRQRCNATRDDTYTNQWCGPEGIADLRRIVAELRGE
jgi:hypothetical protein